MIKPEDILNKTDGGLRIILDLYPQAADCLNGKRHFAIRDEKTPSCSLRQFDSPKYGRIWQVTDFGGEGRGENAISLWMKHNNLDRSRFNEALLQLAAAYGVSDEISKTLNKPDLRQREAHADEPDGSRQFELNEAFTERELQILGPSVTQDTVNALHWYSVKWITNVKNRTVTVKSSNENYPIFLRECIVKPAREGEEEVKFYKVYEPLNYDKAFRFSYTPAGKKPRYYVNGLYELKETYRKLNADREAEWRKLHEDLPYKEAKLECAVICSGERDALCCRSMGYMPLWFNSETYQLSQDEYNEIAKYVETLYNIPDIDETGKRKGRELALKFIDIHTVWLPQWLAGYKDNRGRHRKDLRDWMELRNTKKDFVNLLKLAMPARFWTTSYNKDGRKRHEIDTACLLNFLNLNGFYTLKDSTSDATQYIRINGSIVSRIVTRDIREFVRTWVVDRCEERDILNLTLNSMKLTNMVLENLKSVSPDFTSFTDKSQLFFFPDNTVEVRKAAQGEDPVRVYGTGGDGLHNYVWEDSVIPHKFKRTQPAFTVTKRDGEQEGRMFDIKIHDTSSYFFGYLINTSRLHWRKELEYNFDDAEEAARYRDGHRFCIDGDGLTGEEVDEQKACLVNKIFTLGYMLHRHKAASRAWAPMAMDYKIGDEGQCNGRSGKSFFFSTLSKLMKTVKLSGRNPKLMDNPHVFDQVTMHTDMLLIDDCSRYLNTELFYDNITNDMTVNPKNNRSFTIPFEESPKLAFTTNYVPAEFDPSSDARLLYMVFSDYYHQRTEDNDYNETRTIRNDFGKDLYGDGYTETEWNNDLNFMMDCCAFYLQSVDTNLKPLPPMRNIIFRKHKADMGTNFEDWANGYFSLESGNLDTLLQRDKALEEYMRFAKTTKITMQSFTKKITAFANTCEWVEELNPADLRNASGRILRKVTENGIVKVKDMLYMKSKPVQEDRSLLGGVPEEMLQTDEPF